MHSKRKSIDTDIAARKNVYYVSGTNILLLITNSLMEILRHILMVKTINIRL